MEIIQQIVSSAVFSLSGWLMTFCCFVWAIHERRQKNKAFQDLSISQSIDKTSVSGQGTFVGQSSGEIEINHR